MEICNIPRGQFRLIDVTFTVTDSTTKEEKTMDKLMAISPDGETVVSLQGGIAYRREWLETQIHVVTRCAIVTGTQYVGRAMEKYKELNRAGCIFVHNGKPTMFLKYHNKAQTGYAWMNMQTGEVIAEPEIGKNNKMMAVKNIKYTVAKS